MRYTPLLIRSLLMTLFVLAPAVQAQESVTNAQIMELLQSMTAEQAEMRADIEALKAEKNAPSATAKTALPEVEKPAVSTPDPITRKSGWIASVHPVKDRKEQGKLGKIIIDGFPMKHSESLKKLNVSDPIAYHGAGEIKIEEEGEHTFNMYLIVGKGYPVCKFSMYIEGQEIFNESLGQTKHGSTRTWAKDIDLPVGYYKWELNQYCSNISPKYYDNITWDLRIITPDAMNAVSLGKNYIFHRPK